MAANHENKFQREPSPEPDYEKRDASAKWLFGLVAILYVCIACSQVILHYVNAGFQKKPQPSDRWTGHGNPRDRFGTRRTSPACKCRRPRTCPGSASGKKQS